MDRSRRGSNESSGVAPANAPPFGPYEAAMDALSSLITRKKRGDGSGRSQRFALMSHYIEILNLGQHLSELKVIHVAGTKGKGSTCTFCESILRECGFRTGLFTSPHLIDVRERFRINGLEISEEKFLQYFWDCFNQLKGKVTADLPMPPLFHFLTLLAFQIFLSEKVDVAIVEVGLGGIWDSTNVIKEPVVCGITSLGMDHTEILGDSLAEIASEKAGIFKAQVPAFTVSQLPEAMHVLQERAAKLMIPLKEVAPLDFGRLPTWKLGLDGDHQLINAGLAVSLCKYWLANAGHSKELLLNGQLEELPEPFLKGLSTASFLGRAQVVHDISSKISESVPDDKVGPSGDLVFYLDGAHSPESMEICARWFSTAVGDDINFPRDIQNRDTRILNDMTEVVKQGVPLQILLFNCMEVRDPQVLLPTLRNTCASNGIFFSKALFVPGISTYHKVESVTSTISLHAPKDLLWQYTLQRTWEKMIHDKGFMSKMNEEKENYHFRKDGGMTAGRLPSHDFVCESQQKCHSVDKQFPCSAVISSLPEAIKWLRDGVKGNPSLNLQVLVTGSLHLVGDVLKLLRR